jgi:predicted lipoprotein with Yx(FWY)xxD motif
VTALSRLGARVALSFVAVAATAGCGRGSGSAAPVPSPTLEIRTAAFAQVHTSALVDQQGYALYVFAPDSRRAVTCTATCLLTWPPFDIPNHQRPTLGAGVEAKLIGYDASRGQRVVTYAGWPLYTYTGDVQPGTTSGQAIDLNGGLWYLIGPDGQPITRPVTNVGGDSGTAGPGA